MDDTARDASDAPTGEGRCGGGPSGEPRLPRLPLEGNEPEVQDVFAQFLEERGNVPNMFRVMGKRPRLLSTMISHFGAVMGSGDVSRRLKEMVAIRVSALNHCGY